MVIKRIAAYFIDILIVTIAASMLASISYLNPQLEKYNEVYDEYLKIYDEINELEGENSNEILEKSIEKLNDVNYDLDKNNIYGTIISIALTVAYFVFFQKYNNGQTLGKKLLKIKINEDLSLAKYFVRSLILHSVFANALKVILIINVSKKNYILANNALSVVTLIVEITILTMVILRADNRGLHDIIVGSSVTLKQD